MAESDTKTARSRKSGAAQSQNVRSKAVKPPVIEGKSEVGARRQWWIFPALALAVLLGGGLGVAGSYGLARFNLWPDGSVAFVRAQVDAQQNVQAGLSEAQSGLADQIEALDDRMAALSKVAEQPAPDLTGFIKNDDLAEITRVLSALEQSVSNRIEALKTELSSVETVGVDLSPLQARDTQLAENLAGLSDDIAALGDQIGALESGVNVQALRVGTLENELGTLGQQLEEQSRVSVIAGPNSGDGIARLALALATIDAALDRGDAFTSSLDVVAASGLSLPGLEDVDPNGSPSPQMIVDGFSQLTGELVRIGAGDDAGLAVKDKILSKLKSGIGMRPVGMVAGNDAGAIVARIEVHLARGDFERAAGEWANLPDVAQAMSQDWADGLRGYNEARALVALVRDVIISDDSPATGDTQ